MTSLGRALCILFLTTIANVCANGAQVEHWNVRAYLLLVGGAAATLASGLSKSPRDASLSDIKTGEAPGSSTSAVTTSETKEVIRSAEPEGVEPAGEVTPVTPPQGTA